MEAIDIRALKLKAAASSPTQELTDDDGFAERSLSCFSKNNTFRRACIAIETSSRFHNLVLLVVAYNALLLAISDYSSIVTNRSSPDYGNLDTTNSPRNTVVAGSEIPLVVFYAIEMCIRITAMGFWAYNKDMWNRLDCIVSISGLVQICSTNLNALGFLRTFRMIRPFRFVNKVQGIKTIVSCTISALPELSSVLLLTIFVISLFAVESTQLFRGLIYARCRLTPFPVTTNWTSGADPEAFRCHVDGKVVPPYSTNDLHSSWLKSDSPWATPQVGCFWPVDETDDFACNLYDQSGSARHVCFHDTHWIAESEWRWCGSNFDAWGNDRFGIFKDWTGIETSSKSAGFFPYFGETLQRRQVDALAGTFGASYNWNLVKFDNFFYAFLALVQAMTEEGWSMIMYQLIDTYGVFASIFFILVIVVGTLFALNMVLAVLEAQFSSIKRGEGGIFTVEAPPSETEHAAETKHLSHTNAEAKHLLCRRAKGVWSCFSMPPRASWRNRLKQDVVEKAEFEKAILGLILVNTIVLALDRHPIEKAETDGLEIVGFILTLFFTIEMLLRVAATGTAAYLSDPACGFDAFVVFASLIELAIAPPAVLGGEEGGEGGALTALRCVRLFRISRLLTRWERMQMMIIKLKTAVQDIADASILLALLMFVYILLGMQLFANRLRFDEFGYPVEIGALGWEDAFVPRSNFDSFTQGWKLVFQVITGEDWPSVMHSCWLATGPVAVAFFISIIIFGGFILMNLVLAVLLSNFTIRHEPPDKSGEAQTGTSPSGGGDAAGKASFVSRLSDKKITKEQASLANLVDGALTANPSPSAAKSASGEVLRIDIDYDNVWPLDKGKTLGVFGSDHIFRRQCAAVCAIASFERTTLFVIMVSSVTLVVDSPFNSPDSQLPKALLALDIFFVSYFTAECLIKIVTFGFWEMPRAYMKDEFNVLDFFIVVTSMISMIDSKAGSLKYFRALRAFRSMRPLRTIKRFKSLRIVVYTILNVIPDIGNVLILCMIFFIMTGILFVQNFKGQFRSCQGAVFEDKIEGTDLEELLVYPKAWEKLTEAEKGWFGSEWGTICTSWPRSTHEAPTSRQICSCLGAEWDRVVPQKFDNIFDALATLFEITTTEGWVNVMNAACDARGIGMQPVRDYNVIWVYLFIAVMITGWCLFYNIFIGILFARFVELSTFRYPRGATLDYKVFVECLKISFMFKPVYGLVQPQGRYRRRVFDMVTDERFECTVLWLAFAYFSAMSCRTFGESASVTILLSAINPLYTALFTAEIAVKLYALGFSFFYSAYNCWDFLVFIAWFTTMEPLAYDNSVLASIVLLRSVRLFNILSIVEHRHLRHLQEMLTTISVTAASVFNVTVVIFILFYVYSALGIQLFALVGYNGDFNAHANFRSFGLAMLTLFRFTTGENWNGFMHDVANSDVEGECVDAPEYNENMCGFTNRPGCIPLNGCGTTAIYFYLYSFVIVISLVLMNMFVAILHQGSDEVKQPLGHDDLRRFQEAWAGYDPLAEGYIKVEDLATMMMHIRSPWRFQDDYSRWWLLLIPLTVSSHSQTRRPLKNTQKHLAALAIPIYRRNELYSGVRDADNAEANNTQNYVFYFDVLFTLTAKVVARRITENNGPRGAAIVEPVQVGSPDHLKLCSQQYHEAKMKKGIRAYEDLILELRRFARATIDSIKDKPKGLQPRLNKFCLVEVYDGGEGMTTEHDFAARQLHFFFSERRKQMRRTQLARRAPPVPSKNEARTYDLASQDLNVELKEDSNSYGSDSDFEGTYYLPESPNRANPKSPNSDSLHLELRAFTGGIPASGDVGVETPTAAPAHGADRPSRNLEGPRTDRTRTQRSRRKNERRAKKLRLKKGYLQRQNDLSKSQGLTGAWDFDSLTSDGRRITHTHILDVDLTRTSSQKPHHEQKDPPSRAGHGGSENQARSSVRGYDI